ncbi:MAG: efflux RND transporter periplasmic adaptor subunit [Deltaproteobacteria bacterium]|nr:efflux RND transporter periplasmic adaptor subunit [Deltaproteobacteria bacterium]
MKKKLVFLLILAGVVLLAALYMVMSRNHTGVGEITLSGTIEVTDVDISPELSAKVVSVGCRGGDRVQKGDMLLQLESEAIRAQLRAAEAAQKTAQSQVSIAKERFENTRKTFRRYANLYRTKAVSESIYDDAFTAYRTASDTYTMAKHSFDEVMARIDSLKITLSKTVISSPMDGMVLERNVDPGEVVYPGQVLMVIGDITKPWARVYIEEPDVARVKLGQIAYVVTDAYPDTRFKGVLRYIADRAEFTPKQVQTRQERVRLVFEAKVYIDNQEGILKPGLPVDVYLPLEEGTCQQ